MNALRLTAWLLGSLLVVAGTGCSSKDPEPNVDLVPVHVRYAQTQCADKWGMANTPQQLVTVATAYLVQQGITLTSAQASSVNPPAACAACTCPTGVVLTGATSPADWPALQALGFTQK